MMKALGEVLTGVFAELGIEGAGLPDRVEQTDPLTAQAGRKAASRYEMERDGAGNAVSVLERQEREPSPHKRPVALLIVASNTLKRSPGRGRLSLVLR